MDLYPYFRKWIFYLDPERAHDLTLSIAERFPFVASPWCPEWMERQEFRTEIPGIKKSFPFPIGLAAGLDKDARALKFFSNLGFGFIEVGTVTPLPQPGNSRPRLWRYPEAESLRNCFGFNNQGISASAQRLKKFRADVPLCAIPIGVNLGKNKQTTEELAAQDYLLGHQELAALADYVVINVSSPNTPGLRHLQGEKQMREILQTMKDARKLNPTPLFIKISPDLEKTDVISLAKLTQEFNLAGIVATNTTLRPDLGPGGVSGKWLRDKSRQIRQWCLEEFRGNPNCSVIGVGGVSDYGDLQEFWRQGGKLMQIYTSFIYQGPGIMQRIAYAMQMDMQVRNVNNVEELAMSYLKS